MDHYNDSLSHDEDDDWVVGATENGKILSEGDMKEKVKNVAKKYLKKIKTLQQNKRRQDTRIDRLTRENRNLREKIGTQAAYLEVICGLLGDEIREKFKGRQGIGILGGDSCPDHVDRGKETTLLTGIERNVSRLGEKSDLMEEIDGMTSDGVGNAATRLDSSHHASRFASGFLLDQDNADGFVTGLVDNQENHLYCIEDISEQDSSSLFIC